MVGKAGEFGGGGGWGRAPRAGGRTWGVGRGGECRRCARRGSGGAVVTLRSGPGDDASSGSRGFAGGRSRRSGGLGFEGGQAQGLEQVSPASESGVLGLDLRSDGFALGVGELHPCGAEPGLAVQILPGLGLFPGEFLGLGGGDLLGRGSGLGVLGLGLGLGLGPGQVEDDLDDASAAVSVLAIASDVAESLGEIECLLDAPCADAEGLGELPIFHFEASGAAVGDVLEVLPESLDGLGYAQNWRQGALNQGMGIGMKMELSAITVSSRKEERGAL